MKELSLFNFKNSSLLNSLLSLFHNLIAILSIAIEANIVCIYESINSSNVIPSIEKFSSSSIISLSLCVFQLFSDIFSDKFVK